MEVYIPREADRIMSGNLGFVAICVTQPLWPTRWPPSFRDSLFISVDGRRWPMSMDEQ